MTIRTKKRARLIGKVRTNEELLLKANYSPSTARHQPPSVMKSKSWKQLLESQLPVEDGFKATKDGLQADKIILSPTEPDREYPDHNIRLKAADQVYKLHGIYNETIVNQNFDVKDMRIEIS